MFIYNLRMRSLILEGFTPEGLMFVVLDESIIMTLRTLFQWCWTEIKNRSEFILIVLAASS